MFPATGSTRIAARPSPKRSQAAATPSTSLNATDDRVRGDAGRDTRSGRNAERHHAGPGAREERVDVAVVAARELDHPVAARRRPRQPERAHRGLGAGVDEPYQLDGRDGVDDLGGELDLRLGGGAEGGAAVGGEADGVQGLRVGVPEDQRAPRLNPVEVPRSGDVLDVRPLPAHEEQRLVEADGTHRPHRRVDPSGDEARRSPPELRAARQSHAARSPAQYVTIVPAPARLIAVRVSSAARGSSRCPASAAARTIAYSPETW